MCIRDSLDAADADDIALGRGEGRNRHRNVLQRLLALLGGDHQFFDLVARAFGRRGGREGLGERGMRQGGQGDGGSAGGEQRAKAQRGSRHMSPPGAGGGPPGRVKYVSCERGLGRRPKGSGPSISAGPWVNWTMITYSVAADLF